MEISNLLFNGFDIEFKNSKLSKLLNQKSNSILNMLSLKTKMRFSKVKNEKKLLFK